MNLGLENKRALVTGSSAGIGRAIALELAAEKASVVIHGRRQEAVDALVNEIKSAGGQAEGVVADLATEAGRATLCELLREQPVDILVNNAGRYERQPWMLSTPEKWRSMFETDLFAMVELTQAAVPPMKSRGWGRVIQIASITGLQPYALGPDYGAVKAATLSFTVSLAKDLARTGVTSNAVSPGPTLTDTYEQLIREIAGKAGKDPHAPFEQLESWAATEIAHIPLGRFARPEEVSVAVAFLSSPRADFITGSNLHINGGQYGGIQ